MKFSDADHEILKTYELGNHNAAFKTLTENYSKRLYYHIRRMLHTHEDTDDALQQTLIKAWKGLAKFNKSSSLYTWLFRIATNEALTALEKIKKRRGLSIDDELHYQPVADAYISGDEIQLKLEQAIATLPEKQKMVFHLKYFEELKFSEMAEITGGSQGGLKANYHHAVKKIELFLKST